MKRVLVVENDLDYRETIRDLLNREHYDVILAKDAQEALDEAKKKPDLAVVDLRLKEEGNPNDVSGLDLIASLPNRIPAIILSSNREALPLQAVVNASGGRIRYLLKRGDGGEPTDLAPKIAEILSAKRTALYWVGWGLIALSLLLIFYLWQEKREFLNLSFLQGVVSNLVVNFMWLAGGWMIKRTNHSY